MKAYSTHLHNLDNKLEVDESTSIMGAEYIYKISAKQLESFLIGLKRLGFSWLQEAATNFE